MSNIVNQDFDPNTCAQILADKGETSCDPQGEVPNHCNSLMVTDAYHESCADRAVYSPVQFVCCQHGDDPDLLCLEITEILAKCTELGKEDPTWKLKDCKCCCACYARDTLVLGADNKFKEMHSFAVNDKILTGKLDGDKVVWDSTGTIDFSDGTGAGAQPYMMYVAYLDANGKHQEFVCSTDQPLVLDNGKLILAQSLTPSHQLQDKDGKSVKVEMCALGEFYGGMHHIGVSKHFDGTPNGHLLLIGGVAAGDYELQTNYASIDSKYKVAENLPSIGSDEYAKQANITEQDSFQVIFSHKQKIDKNNPAAALLKAGKFKPYTQTANATNSNAAQQLFTDDQAADILAKGSQVPVSNTIPVYFFESVKKHLAGYYPDIRFVYDAMNVSPNLYAFEFYGQKTVVINGGLARMISFNYEGIAMAMAWGVSCFIGNGPYANNGLSGVGVADFTAFGKVSRDLWIGDNWIDYSQRAMTQWANLFKFVSPEHAKGNPLDPINQPSLACRTQALQNGFLGGYLPECAGGKPLPKICVQDVEATSLNSVIVSFSIALTEKTGLDINNYALDSGATVTKASFVDKEKFKVELATELKPNGKYTLRVSDLESYIGSKLDPAHSTATFVAPSK